VILCVTPNPDVERTLIVPGFRMAAISRATHVLTIASGKGINVARAIRTLGYEALCMGFLGGHIGRLVAELAEREGLSGNWTWIEGESRTATIIIDPDTDGSDATTVDEDGPTVSADDWARLHADVLRVAGHADCVCLCGSLPPGSPTEAFADLLRALKVVGRPIWVDSSGAALRTALAAGLTGIKVNSKEAGAILGDEVGGVEAAAKAATELQRMGSGTVVLTLGATGAVMVNETGGWWASPPPRQVVSTVGSGDAFLAGLVAALAAGTPPAGALRQAVAVGAANTLSPGGGRFELSDFDAALVEVAVNPLPFLA
jgi:1-phosphofructokinase